MSVLEQICANAAGAMLGTHRSITVTNGVATHVLKVVRVPTADELVALETCFEAVPRTASSYYCSTLDGASFAERVQTVQFGFENKGVVVPVSVMQMAAPADVVRAEVDLAVLGPFLHEVGEGTVAENLDDAQFVMGELYGAREEDIAKISGLVIDIDADVEDPATHYITHRARQPNVAFATESGGARLVYAFDYCPIEHGLMSARDDLFDQLMLAFPGVDPRCGDVTQRQHLPVAVRTTKGPRHVIRREPITLSAMPLRLAEIEPGFPVGVLDVLELGGPGVSDNEREEVIRYLEALGTPPPAPGTQSPCYARCPEKQHSGRKAYVNRGPGGALNVRCLGGHGGRGQLHWSERDLLALARGAGA